MAYSADGALQFVEFRDELLGFACEFALDENGTPRCFPRQGPYNALVFADSACQEPAIWMTWNLKQGDWFHGPSPSPAACAADLPNGGPLFQVGDLLRAPPAEYDRDYAAYSWRDGQCERSGPPAKSQPPLHRLVSHPTTKLVSAKLLSSPATSDLRVTRIVAEDGAARNLRPTLADHAPCALVADGTCVPEPIAVPSPGVWLDADCTAPSLRSVCEGPKFGVLSDTAGQQHVVELVPALQKFTRELVLPIAENGSYSFACTGSVGDASVLTAGREVVGRLPKAEPIRLGQGLLHANMFRVGAHVLAAVGQEASLRSADGTKCYPNESPDGSLRCLSEHARLIETSYCADEACKTRLYAREDAATRAFDPALLASSFVLPSYDSLEGMRAATLHSGIVFTRSLSGEQAAPVSPDDKALRALFGPNPTALLVPDRLVSPNALPRVELLKL